MTGKDVYLEHDWLDRPLPRNVVIGDGTWIYSSYSFLHYRSEAVCGLELGRDCGVYIGTFFDLGPRATMKVGDVTTLAGPVISTRGHISIGDYCFFSYHVVIADSAAAAPSPAGDQRSGRDIRIGDNVWVGARSIILGGATIGDDAIIGAASVVDFDVPDGAIVAGNPAKVIRRRDASAS